MSKHDPEKFPPSFVIRFQDTPVKCHKQNTWIYTFDKSVGYDHVFIDRSSRNVAKGIYLWQKEVFDEHGHEIWHTILQGLGRVGCETVREDKPSDADLKAYAHKFGAVMLDAVKEPETHELTQRQENHVSYFHEVLERGIITPEDFQLGPGELYI